MSKLVTVVSLFYNRAVNVKDSVQSLLEQTYTNLEIIIIDDCSTDGTYDELCKFEDNRLHIIRHNVNTGFVRGLISAINQSNGDYIAIHGSGDISYPTRIEKQVALLDSDDKIGVVGCNVLERYSKDNGMEINYTHRCIESKFNRRYLLESANCFTHGEVMFKMKYYRKVGGYRPAFWYAQDRDLWIRMIDVCKFGSINEILYERTFVQNSVRFNPVTTILQIKYSVLSVECAYERDLHGNDVVDKYGIHAIGFQKKSRLLAKKYYNTFQKYLRNDREASLAFLEASNNELFSIKKYLYIRLINHIGVDNFFKIFELIHGRINLGIKRKVKRLLLNIKKNYKNYN